MSAPSEFEISAGGGPPAGLVLRGLRYAYPDGTEALSGLDLAVAPGERVAVLGPNGAGKTTLALHCNGLLRAAEGSVQVGEVELADPTLTEIRRQVGFVFQDPDDQLFLGTVREDVAFGPANLGLRGEVLRDRVQDALHAVEAEHLAARAPHHLSGGERRRVALATVLAMRPRLLVLDEPTSNLDPAGRRELHDVLVRLPVTQLVVTHDLPFALELCPRAVVVSGGRVVADGSTADLLADEGLLRANRLELPFGFDPRSVVPPR
ncbi:energy-coupling factor ABC transporter ATP-binding protein [Egicoccus sp. AB-alg6-2]|uniref:energy-coupling factor ABC transporter ATP-binding protein n=1 Tax=Egicoccus sp. AB-alg6-2 TaxID=3242692 RepID=UPI00359D72BC